VEGHGAHLEGEAGDHQRHRDEHEAEVDLARGRSLRHLGERGVDAGEVGVAGGAVEQRAAVEEQRGGEGAEQEVLHGGLRAARRAAAEAGEGVDAERHGLEPEEEREQIPRGGEDDRADRGEGEERVELAAVELVLGQVAAGEERGEAAAQAEEEREEEREAVDDQVGRGVAEAVELVGADEPHGDRRGRAREERDGGAEGEIGRGAALADVALLPPVREGLGHHQEETADDDDEERREADVETELHRAPPGAS